MEKNLKCPRRLIETLLPEDILDSKTICECVQSFDIDSQLKAESMYLFQGSTISIDTTILRAFSVLRRLKIEDEEIIRLCLPLFNTTKDMFCRFLAPYLLLLKPTNEDLTVKIVEKQHDDSPTNIVEVSIDKGTGLGVIENNYACYNKIEPTNMARLYEKILEYIVK